CSVIEKRDLAPTRGPLEALGGFVEGDVAAGEGVEDVERRVGNRVTGDLDADATEKGVEAGPGGGVAHTEVALEVLHVPARREEHLQQGPVVGRERAELTRGERARQLRMARRTGEASDLEA